MSDTKSVVYVVNLIDHKNYDGLDKFGEVIFMSKGILDRHSITQLNEKFFTFAKDAISDANHNAEIFLVLSGPSYACAIAYAAFVVLREDTRLIRWDNREQKYIEMTE
jgi:hypothetical protein